MSRRRVGIVLAVVTVLSFPTVFGRRAEAYLHFATGAATGPSAKWAGFPVVYFVGTRSLPNVSAEQFQGVVQAGFDRWREASGGRVSGSFAGFVSGIEPPVRDGINLVAVQDLPAGVLGVTYVRFNTQTGELADIDMGIAATQPWSANPAGEAGRFDLRATVTHEIGHLLGMAHSALGETTLIGTGRRVQAAETIMFPIAFSPGSAVRPVGTDDVAGISDLYPPAGFREGTGSITGRVRKAGRGVFGAHVVAFDPASKALVAAFSLSTEGDFTIAGLTPGPKVLRVEPLDDAAVTSFFSSTAPVDAAFAVTFAPEIVLVSAGKTTGPVTVEVSR